MIQFHNHKDHENKNFFKQNTFSNISRRFICPSYHFQPTWHEIYLNEIEASLQVKHSSWRPPAGWTKSLLLSSQKIWEMDDKGDTTHAQWFFMQDLVRPRSGHGFWDMGYRHLLQEILSHLGQSKSGIHSLRSQLCNVLPTLREKRHVSESTSQQRRDAMYGKDPSSVPCSVVSYARFGQTQILTWFLRNIIPCW